MSLGYEPDELDFRWNLSQGWFNKGWPYFYYLKKLFNKEFFLNKLQIFSENLKNSKLI